MHVAAFFALSEAEAQGGNCAGHRNAALREGLEQAPAIFPRTV